jgi:hypothetical protein
MLISFCILRLSILGQHGAEETLGQLFENPLDAPFPDSLGNRGFSDEDIPCAQDPHTNCNDGTDNEAGEGVVEEEEPVAEDVEEEDPAEDPPGDSLGDVSMPSLPKPVTKDDNDANNRTATATDFADKRLQSPAAGAGDESAPNTTPKVARGTGDSSKVAQKRPPALAKGHKGDKVAKTVAILIQCELCLKKEGDEVLTLGVLHTHRCGMTVIQTTIRLALICFRKHHTNTLFCILPECHLLRFAGHSFPMCLLALRLCANTRRRQSQSNSNRYKCRTKTKQQVWWCP